MTETVGIAVNFGKENLRFHQTVISVADETKLRQRLFGKTEQEKEEKAFELNVAALAEFQGEQMERITFDETGAEVIERMDVKVYFAEETAVKARIAEYAMRGFLMAISPNVNFF